MKSPADQQTIVAVDIGGTNARFALARITAGERPVPPMSTATMVWLSVGEFMSNLPYRYCETGWLLRRPLPVSAPEQNLR